MAHCKNLQYIVSPEDMTLGKRIFNAAKTMNAYHVHLHRQSQEISALCDTDVVSCFHFACQAAFLLEGVLLTVTSLLSHCHF